MMPSIIGKVRRTANRSCKRMPYPNLPGSILFLNMSNKRRVFVNISEAQKLITNAKQNGRALQMTSVALPTCSRGRRKMPAIMSKINWEYSLVEAFTIALFRYRWNTPRVKIVLKNPRPLRAKITLPVVECHSKYTSGSCKHLV